mgnify:CR=1 FL=1
MCMVFYGPNGDDYANFYGDVIEMIDGEEKIEYKKMYLGRTVDKEENIFYDKKNSLFKFDPKTGEKISLKIAFQGFTIKNFKQALSVWTEKKDSFLKNISTAIKSNAIQDTALQNESDEKIDWDSIRLNSDVQKVVLINSQTAARNVTFGKTFFTQQLIHGIGYEDAVIKQVCLHSGLGADVVDCLLFYRFGHDTPYSYMDAWQTKDFISILYPNCNLSSQRASEYLASLGNPDVSLNFHKFHIDFVKRSLRLSNVNVYIDSSHFDNKCMVYISRVYYHNNIRHEGFRILTVVHIPTGLPLYYEIIPGNIVDQNLLDHTIKKLNKLGCEINHVCGDAGFGNINTLERLIFIDGFMSFTTRVNPIYNLFKNAAEDAIKKIDSKNCEKFRYNDRTMYGVKNAVMFTDPNDPTKQKKVFQYTFLDEDRRAAEIAALKKSKRYKTMTNEEYFNEIKKYGIFSLISSRDLTLEQALKEYYDRMSIEQFFDVFKNGLNALPVRAHSQKTIRGHILLCFIASFFYILIKRRMQTFDSKYINIYPTYNNDDILECDPANLETDIIEQEVSNALVTTPIHKYLYELDGHFASVFSENTDINGNTVHVKTVIPDMPIAQVNELYKAFGLVTPTSITYYNNKCHVEYGKNTPNGRTKELAFAAHPCKGDLKKLSKINNQTTKQSVQQSEDFVAKDNVSNDSISKNFVLDNFYNIFDAKLNHHYPGRPKGSLNKATIAKQTEEDNKAFNTFDNFFAPWWNNTTDSDSLAPDAHAHGSGQSKESLNKSTIDNQTEDKAFDTFDNFFAPWWNDTTESDSSASNTPARKPGRPKGSLNRATIAKQAEENNRLFNTFDDFYAWCEVRGDENGESSPSRGPGRPEGRKNLKTANREAFMRSEGIDPGTPYGRKVAMNLRTAEKKLTDEGIDPYSNQGQMCLKETLDAAIKPNQAKHRPGRPKGSLNKATIERQLAENNAEFNTFDHFYSWSDREGQINQGKPRLKYAKTIKRETFMLSLGIDPNTIRGERIAKELCIAEKRLTNGGYDPYSPFGQILLAEIIGVSG